jgi:hypothetical protein
MAQWRNLKQWNSIVDTCWMLLWINARCPNKEPPNHKRRLFLAQTTDAQQLCLLAPILILINFWLFSWLYNIFQTNGISPRLHPRHGCLCSSIQRWVISGAIIGQVSLPIWYKCGANFLLCICQNRDGGRSKRCSPGTSTGSMLTTVVLGLCALRKGLIRG